MDRGLVSSDPFCSIRPTIDGAVLEVILRKAERIRKATGVTVPLPEDRGAVTGALMNAVLLRKGRGRQLTFDFGLSHDVTLDPGLAPTSSLGRAGAWPTSGVKSVTTILLIRLRFKLTVHGRRERLLLVEEAGAMASDVSSSEASASGEVALALLDHPSTGDLAPIARQRILTQARDRATTTFSGPIAAHARRRAAELAQDHARVRAAGIGAARVSVEPVLPPDIIGLYVLLPQGA